MKLLFITFLFFSTNGFSQKQYRFDYIIEYEMTFFKDSIKINDRPFRENNKTIKKYYLTNSNKNNYTAVIKEWDSLRYKMIFKDEDGIYSDIIILKTDLMEAEIINIDCKNVTKHYNPFKYKTKYYDFFKLNDTFLNGKAYGRYKLESIKPKRTKREKLGAEFYIIDKETSFHFPILTFSTAYEEWKTVGNLQNGIFFQKYFIDYYGYLDSKETLKNYWKTNKKIVINEECNYTEKK